jgi:hypothetical protein
MGSAVSGQQLAVSSQQSAVSLNHNPKARIGRLLIAFYSNAPASSMMSSQAIVLDDLDYSKKM